MLLIKFEIDLNQLIMNSVNIKVIESIVKTAICWSIYVTIIINCQ